jgi:hypothetical protein
MTKEMISIFPLWTFHLYVATFQDHLHMEYLSSSHSDVLPYTPHPTESSLPHITIKGVWIYQTSNQKMYISDDTIWACGSYQYFIDRGLLLTRKLLNQGFFLVKLKSSLRKCYGRHHDLVDRYEISMSQKTTDTLHLS